MKTFSVFDNPEILVYACKKMKAMEFAINRFVREANDSYS